MVLKFGFQADGYWNNELFIKQVKTPISIAKFKYPVTQNTLVFLFDQSSGHCAYSDDALIAHKMNVLDGGNNFLKRYCLGWKTSKTASTGIQKGLKTLLEERGVNTNGLKKRHD